MLGLPVNGLEALCRRLSFVHVLPGSVLLRQGQQGDSMFMLVSGSAQIYQRYGALKPEHGTVPFHSDLCTYCATYHGQFQWQAPCMRKHTCAFNT